MECAARISSEWGTIECFSCHGALYEVDLTFVITTAAGRLELDEDDAYMVSELLETKDSMVAEVDHVLLVVNMPDYAEQVDLDDRQKELPVIQIPTEQSAAFIADFLKLHEASGFLDLLVLDCCCVGEEKLFRALMFMTGLPEGASERLARAIGLSEPYEITTENPEKVEIEGLLEFLEVICA